MKVLLIRPHNEGNINTRLPESLNKRQGSLPPLGIAYIASALQKAGHIVKILDVTALNLVESEIRSFIKDFCPKLVGVTTMTSTLFGALASAKIAKETGSITVLGGPQLAIYPEETLSYSYVDYGIVGEGESAIVELAHALETNKNTDNIKGLIYKKNGSVKINEPVIAENLDLLPFPAYDLLPMNKYDSIIGLYPVSTMVTSRGCPYKCHFCFKQPSDVKFRFRSAWNIVDEMEFLAKKYKVREIMFYDDVITARRSHIVGICEEILSRKLMVAWEAPSRIDTIDKPMLELMRKAGCIRLRYGVESGDENILKLMNKNIDLKKIKEVFKWTKEVNINTFAYFIIGYAHETEKTVRKSIDLALELDPDLVMFTIATPYPKTPLYELAMNEGLLKYDYWRDFTLGRVKDKRLPYFLPNAEKWTKKAYTKFYLRPKYIFKRLSQIRCWGDFLKSLSAARGILDMKSK